MRYWDASALVPLIVAEPGSGLARTWLREDGHIVTWAWTRTEITSAIERRAREGALTRRERRTVLDRLRRLAAGWDEVIDVDAAEREGLRVADTGD